jgi:hypothetical protein
MSRVNSACVVVAEMHLCSSRRAISFILHMFNIHISPRPNNPFFPFFFPLFFPFFFFFLLFLFFSSFSFFFFFFFFSFLFSFSNFFFFFFFFLFLSSHSLAHMTRERKVKVRHILDENRICHYFCVHSHSRFIAIAVIFYRPVIVSFSSFPQGGLFSPSVALPYYCFFPLVYS